MNLTNVIGDNRVIRNLESPNQEAFDKMQARGEASAKSKGTSLQELKNTSSDRAMNSATIAGIRGDVPDYPSIEVPGSGLERKPEYKANRITGQWYSGDSYEKQDPATKNETKQGN